MEFKNTKIRFLEYEKGNVSPETFFMDTQKTKNNHIIKIDSNLDSQTNFLNIIKSHMVETDLKLFKNFEKNINNKDFIFGAPDFLVFEKNEETKKYTFYLAEIKGGNDGLRQNQILWFLKNEKYPKQIVYINKKVKMGEDNKKMINGQLIEYRSKNRRSLVHINLILFGRINKQKHRGRVYTYYQKGALHNIPYVQLSQSKYFVKGTCDLPTDKIQEHTSLFKIEPKNMELNEEDFKTACKHWNDHAENLGYKIKIVRKNE